MGHGTSQPLSIYDFMQQSLRSRPEDPKNRAGRADWMKQCIGAVSVAVPARGSRGVCERIADHALSRRAVSACGRRRQPHQDVKRRCGCFIPGSRNRASGIFYTQYLVVGGATLLLSAERFYQGTGLVRTRLRARRDCLFKSSGKIGGSRESFGHRESNKSDARRIRSSLSWSFVYNLAGLLRRAIDSVLAQEFALE